MNGIQALKPDEMSRVPGGKDHSGNYNPGNIGGGIDKLINGKNYEAVAVAIVKKIQPDPPRTRNVDNSVDIDDCDI